MIRNGLTALANRSFSRGTKLLRGPMLISFPNDKGGAGKTTVCVSLAAAFAARGDVTHVVDIDGNGTATRWLSGRLDARTHISCDVLPTPLQRITVSRPPAQQLIPHIRSLHALGKFAHLLVDLPGTREAANLKAMLVSDLVIIPAAPQEAPFEGAMQAIADLTDMLADSGRRIPYRLLRTAVKFVAPAAQHRILKEIETQRIPRFATAIMQRAPYEEIGLTGLPPHAADQTRLSVQKAVAEIDALVTEIAAIFTTTTTTTSHAKVA
jgi:chromosome partitioning protein